MEFLKFLARESYNKLGVVLVFSVIYGITAGLLPPLVVQAFIDIVGGKSYFAYLFLLPAIIAVQMTTYWFAETTTTRLVEDRLQKVILQIADTVRRDELTTFERRNKSEIRVSIEEARNVAEGAVQFIRVFQCLIIVVTIWLYIFTVSKVAGLFFLCVYGLTTMAHEVILKLVREKLERIAKADVKLFDIFRHFLEGFKELRIDWRKNQTIFKKYFLPVLDRVKNLRHQMSFISRESNITAFASVLILAASYVFILPLFGHVATETKTVLIICTMYTLKPSILVMVAIPLLANGEASLKRLEQFDAKSDKSSIYGSDAAIWHPQTETIKEFNSLVLKDIMFEYGDTGDARGFSIGPIDIDLQAGDTLFVAGGNGCGKSTMIKVITGLYPVKSGNVAINGKSVNLQEHRYLFSTIFSDFHLFNSIYGMEKPDEQEIQDLIRLMCLERKTSYKNGSFSNIDLSAGQRRRLAMVSVLPEDKPIYIFDEWAADQDPHFRKYFYKELLPSLKERGKTVIVVTHDERYYNCTDRIIFMKDGRIVSERPAETAVPEKKKPNPSRAQAVSKARSKPERVESADDFKTSDKKESELEKTVESFFNVKKFMPELKKMGWMAIVDGIIVTVMLRTVLHASHLVSESQNLSLFAMFVALMTAFIVLTRHFNRVTARLVEDVIATTRIMLIERVRRIGLFFFEKIGASKIYTSLTSDMNRLTLSLFMLSMVCRIMFNILFPMAYIAALSMRVFVIEMFLVAAVTVLYFFNQFHAKKAVEVMRDGETEFFTAATHLLEGFKELRLNDRKNDSFFYTCLKPASSKVKKARLKAGRHMTFNTTIVYGAWSLLMGTLPLLYPFADTSAHIMFRCLAIIAFLPVNIFVIGIPPFILGLSAAQRLQGLIQDLDEGGDDLVPQVQRSKRRPFRELRFRDVVFRYKDEGGDWQFEVGPLNLDIQANEVVYVTGGNGSGKSTMIKLLTGLYMPDAGRVMINGLETDIRRHRYLFSTVFSDFHLFDRLYGMSRVNKGRLNELLEMMRLERKIQFKNGRFTTLNLSSGQKKRLALICAMLEDREVYILDEWAAEQDPYYRGYFYETLMPELKERGKTIIAVTHHDQHFHTADRIIKMDYGRIASTED